MTSWLPQAFALVLIVSSVTPVIAQEAQPQPEPAVEIAQDATPVTRATIATNALAITTLLFNPTDANKPIPLYGYQISDLQESTLSAALDLAARGRVHVALVNESDEDESTQGRAVRVSANARSVDRVRAIQTASTSSAPSLIAFTRPLRNREAVARFITTPSLWSQFRAAQ